MVKQFQTKEVVQLVLTVNAVIHSARLSSQLYQITVIFDVIT